MWWWLTGASARREEHVLAELRAEAEAAAEQRVAAAAGGGVAAAAPQALSALPPCVQRYLELAATGAPDFKLVTSRQAGEFKFDPSGPWQTLEATQCASPLVPAFLWSACCSFKPLIGMQGFDSRTGGSGRIDWRLWGWLPAHAAAGPPLDSSLLARWLAEAPGFPKGLLPSSWLRWEAVPGSTSEARAVLTHRGSTANGVFSFDKTGLVSGFRSEDYVMPLPGGVQERRPLVVLYRAHKRVPVHAAAGGGADSGGDMLVPTESEALRVDADGRELPYVRITLQGLTAEV